jgi:hypothetical protein
MRRQTSRHSSEADRLRSSPRQCTNAFLSFRLNLQSYSGLITKYLTKFTEKGNGARSGNFGVSGERRIRTRVLGGPLIYIYYSSLTVPDDRPGYTKRAWCCVDYFD